MSVATHVVNAILTYFVYHCVIALNFPTTTGEMTIMSLVMFVVTFFNTALISLLEAAAFEDNAFMDRIFDKDGETDFSEKWYAITG